MRLKDVGLGRKAKACRVAGLGVEGKRFGSGWVVELYQKEAVALGRTADSLRE